MLGSRPVAKLLRTLTASVRVSGGRTWWTDFEFTRINIEPIILKNKSEDLLDGQQNVTVVPSAAVSAIGIRIQVRRSNAATSVLLPETRASGATLRASRHRVP